VRIVDTVQGPFRVWAVDQVGAVLSGGAFWDWPIQPAIDRAAARQPEGWALDLGAAFGWFTVYLAKRFARVLAVEAHPDTVRELLLPNLEAHGLTNVEVKQLVATDRSGPYVLAPAAWHGWPLHADLDQQPNASSFAFVRYPAGGEADGNLMVYGHKVDDFVPAEAEVAVIKVDVQGCDLRALVGLEQTVARCRPTIAFEIEGGPSGWHGDSEADYFRWFAERGYRVETLPGSNYVGEPEERT